MKRDRWVLLAASLPGRGASTARVRLWRTLRELGAASLRDGVTLAPSTPPLRDRLAELAAAIEAEGGAAWLFELPAQPSPVEEQLERLFDRSAAYAQLDAPLGALEADYRRLDEGAARRRLRQVTRSFDAIGSVDFFPGAAREAWARKIASVRDSLDRWFSPDEPAAAAGEVPRRSAAAFQGQRWATRKRLWVDRAASAWLIKRFIDPEARFLWLDRIGDCPSDAHGFDFDGAAFTHVGERVTFEVLAASFDLETDIALQRLGRLVRYLDASGESVPEAAGFEAVLGGLRGSCSGDDELLEKVTPVLDALYLHFAAAPP